MWIVFVTRSVRVAPKIVTSIVRFFPKEKRRSKIIGEATSYLLFSSWIHGTWHNLISRSQFSGLLDVLFWASLLEVLDIQVEFSQCHVLLQADHDKVTGECIYFLVLSMFQQWFVVLAALSWFSFNFSAHYWHVPSKDRDMTKKLTLSLGAVFWGTVQLLFSFHVVP